MKTSILDKYKGRTDLIERENKLFDEDRRIALMSSSEKYAEPYVRIVSDYPSGIIELDLFSEVMSSLQKIGQSANNHIHGNRSTKGRMTPLIVQESKLLITGTYPGSFVVSFDSAENKNIEKQLSMNDNENMNTIELLSKVVSDVATMSKESETSTFLENYGARTFREVASFVKEIKSQNISLEIDFKENQVLEFNNKVIDNTIDLFENKKIETKQFKEKLKGYLIGVNNQRRELIFKDGNQIQKVTVSDDSLDRVSMKTNAYYNFNVDVEIERDISQNSEISRTYSVETIDEL